METYQMFACAYRPGDPTAPEYAVEAQVSHPLIQGETLDFRFYFDTLEDLLWTLIDAEPRGCYREARLFIYDIVESTLHKGLCDVSYDDERRLA